MIRRRHAVSLLTLAVFGVSCTGLSSGLNAKPADLYAIVPSQAAVRSLLGDSNWWASPPSFEVRPLDAETTPGVEKFSISELYLHMGTAEELFARYTVYDKTSSATTTMTDYKTAFGTSPTTPKVGDEVLYYPVAGGGGGAPYVTRTFVREGQVILTLSWARKDNNTKVDALAKNARTFAAGMRDIGKAHSSLVPADNKLLPPPGRLITFLGSAQLPIEAFVALTRTTLADYALQVLHSSGVTTFVYGDYALNNDTHMEVQTALLKLPTSADGQSFSKLFGPSPTPDSDGIYSGYIPIGGTPAAGVYMYVLASGQYGLMVVCKASIEGEAATRECEGPSHDTALAWKLALNPAG